MKVTSHNLSINTRILILVTTLIVYELKKLKECFVIKILKTTPLSALVWNPDLIQNQVFIWHLRSLPEKLRAILKRMSKIFNY